MPVNKPPRARSVALAPARAGAEAAVGVPPPSRLAGCSAPKRTTPGSGRKPDVPSESPRLTLVQRWGVRTWLGRTDDGALVVARRFSVPRGAAGVDGRSLSRRTAELVTTRVPPLVPVLGVIQRGGALWVVSELDGGISLHRLLQRSKPSLMQVTTLAARLLEAVAALHAAGHAHGGLQLGNVHVDPRAEVRLVDWGLNALAPTGPQDELRRADLEAAAAMVDRLTRAAAGAGAPANGGTAQILTALEAAASAEELTRRGPASVAAALEASLGGEEEREAVRDGLTGLVRAVARRAPGGGRLESPDGPAAGPGARESWRDDRLGRTPGAVWSRTWRVAAVVAVIGALVGVELAVFGDDVTRNLQLLVGRRPARGEALAGAAPGERRPGPLPVLAPPAGGPVTGVELRPLDPCRAGQACTVVVQMRLQPQPRPLRMAWRFEVVDRCREARESHPGGTAEVPPGRDRLVETNPLVLPQGRSLAVIALTTEPVSVAGSPMRLPGDDGPC